MTNPSKYVSGPILDCEACMTPDACAIRGQCAHYLREREAPQAVSTPAQPAQQGELTDEQIRDACFGGAGTPPGWEQSGLQVIRRIIAADRSLRTPPAPPAVEPAAQPLAVQWLPIESAPKDHLVDIFAYGKRYNACHYDRICSEFRHITHCGVLIRLRGATHWMEMLPAPPAPTLSASAGASPSPSESSP